MQGEGLTFCSIGDSETSGLSTAAWPRRIRSVRAAAYRFPSAHQKARPAGSSKPDGALLTPAAAYWPASCGVMPHQSATWPSIGMHLKHGKTIQAVTHRNVCSFARHFGSHIKCTGVFMQIAPKKVVCSSLSRPGLGTVREDSTQRQHARMTTGGSPLGVRRHRPQTAPSPSLCAASLAAAAAAAALLCPDHWSDLPLPAQSSC